MARNSNRARFGGMMKLHVATPSANQKPPIIFQEADNIPNFHGQIVAIHLNAVNGCILSPHLYLPLGWPRPY